MHTFGGHDFAQLLPESPGTTDHEDGLSISAVNIILMARNTSKISEGVGLQRNCIPFREDLLCLPCLTSGDDAQVSDKK